MQPSRLCSGGGALCKSQVAAEGGAPGVNTPESLRALKAESASAVRLGSAPLQK